MNRLSEEPIKAQTPPPPPGDPALPGKILFMIATGVLIGTLVSCACGPIR